MAAKYASDLDGLQDEITCPICLEIFTDPQALPCLHTLCLQCVKDIARNRETVPCPTCRALTTVADLKNDFRMARSIERYQQGQEHDKLKPNSGLCELCEEKTAIYKCQRCSIIICQTCKKIHIKTSNCEEGHTATLDAPATRTKVLRQLEKLTVWKTVLQEHAATEQTWYDNDIQKMDDQRQEALKSIDTQEDEALQHFRKERQKVNINTNETKSIRTTEHDEYQQKVTERINYINSMERADDDIISQLFEITIDELKKELEKLQKTSFTLTEMTIKNTEFDKAKAVTISFSVESRPPVNQAISSTPSHSKSTRSMSFDTGHNKSTGSVNADTNDTVGYSRLGMDSPSIRQSHPLHDRVWKMLTYNGELLCLMDSRIEAYNPSTGQHVRTLPTLLRLARSMAMTSSGHLLVVALGKPKLLKYNISKKRGQSLSKDVHWDVAALEGGAVAVRVKGGVLYIDYYDSELQRIGQTPTPVQEDGRFTCAVARGHLYVSSESQHTIYKIDVYTGRILRAYGAHGETQVGHLTNPIISCSDGRILLIADLGNRRVQTLDCKTKEWKVLTIEGLIEARAAVVDEAGTLFVAGVRPDTLYIIN